MDFAVHLAAKAEQVEEARVKDSIKNMTMMRGVLRSNAATSPAFLDDAGCHGAQRIGRYESYIRNIGLGYEDRSIARYCKQG